MASRAPDQRPNIPQIEFKSLPLTRFSVSGGSDPRTATTVFLFEEFVPLEYRQQLSAGAQNKRTLASFFSPGKTKQWKQAPTLNGRPYVVGHVPRSLNSREVEFEGLIRSNNGSTKMISLGRDGPVKRDVVPPESRPSSQTPIPWRSPRSEDVSSPMFLAPRESTVIRPSPPATPPITAKRRFRLPTGLPLSPNRTSGLTPSEAEDIEFETRLASYSDDELQSIHSNSRRMTKHERRASKDDAWVDILVANHARRAVNQDADLRRPGGSRGRNVSRPDPEIASQEVAQVLAAIRGPSPAGPFDGDSDIEPMNVPHRSMINSHGAELEETYAQTYALAFMEMEGPVEPEPQPDPEPELEPEVESEPEAMPEPQETRELPQPPPRPPRRVGYFDLHPERRLGRIEIDEDPRDNLVRSLAESERDGPRRSDVTESIYSSGSASPPPASPPQPALAELAMVAEPSSPATPSPQTPTAATYSPRDLQRQQEVRDRLAGKPGPKASSLIELYREKERLATGGSKGSPGKLPATAIATVATAATATATTIASAAPLPPLSEPSSTPPATPASSATPTQGLEEVAEGAELVGAPGVEINQGRESPYRYVHGAPLHNVVEEEEED